MRSTIESGVSNPLGQFGFEIKDSSEKFLLLNKVECVILIQQDRENSLITGKLSVLESNIIPLLIRLSRLLFQTWTIIVAEFLVTRVGLLMVRRK